ncbi:hypothetical protein TrRE_jg8495 [Triparma retinervis]|uniref:Uncharacterized protein n=1 Tax=Triparma retinervis TaxID=2557542 RepID=A0A9W7FUW2_9STRA|nr:hypothetical protein TrRE_jg8495 [Triparma retinervis]
MGQIGTKLSHDEAHRSKRTSLNKDSAFIAFSPLVSLAEEVDNYEYGAVNAPIGIAWGVGVLAIATSFLPLLLKGGEEALDDMRENEGYSFGKGKDTLGKNRRKKN